jgi:hypothetical protein
MLKDIPFPKVENIGLAVVKDVNEEGEEGWYVFIINMGMEQIDGVIVSSRGYGTYENRDVDTTVLRHYLGSIAPRDYTKIELIVDNLFGLNNEYWVSFFIDKTMYDKKFIFLPESIKEEHFTLIPVMEKKGVLIA